MNGIEQKIILFLLENCKQPNISSEKISSCQDLYAHSLLDSLLNLRLLNFLEKEFSIQIPPFQVIRKNFLTVDSITKLVKSLQ